MNISQQSASSSGMWRESAKFLNPWNSDVIAIVIVSIVTGSTRSTLTSAKLWSKLWRLDASPAIIKQLRAYASYEYLREYVAYKAPHTSIHPPGTFPYFTVLQTGTEIGILIYHNSTQKCQ